MKTFICYFVLSILAVNAQYFRLKYGGKSVSLPNVHFFRRNLMYSGRSRRHTPCRSKTADYNNDVETYIFPYEFKDSFIQKALVNTRSYDTNKKSKKWRSQRQHKNIIQPDQSGLKIKKHTIAQVQSTRTDFKRTKVKKSKTERKATRKDEMYVLDSSEIGDDENSRFDRENPDYITDAIDGDDNIDTVGARKEIINRNNDELIVNEDGENAEYLTPLTDDDNEDTDNLNVAETKYNNAVEATSLTSSDNQNQQISRSFPVSTQVAQISTGLIPVTQLTLKTPPNMLLKPLNSSPIPTPQVATIQSATGQTKAFINQQPIMQLESIPKYALSSPSGVPVMQNIILENEGRIPQLPVTAPISNLNSNSDAVLRDSYRDGLSVPYLESTVMIKQNMAKGKYLPLTDTKDYEKDFTKQVQVGEMQAGTIQETDGSKLHSVKYNVDDLGKVHLSGDGKNIDKSILSAITEEVKKDSKLINAMPNNRVNDTADDDYIAMSIKAPNQKQQQNEQNPITKSLNEITDPQQNKIETSTGDAKESTSVNNIYSPDTEDQQNNKNMVNDFADQIASSQNNFQRYDDMILKKMPPSLGLDIQPSITSLAPDEQRLMSKIDNDVRAKYKPKEDDNKIFLPTKEDALSDRTVAPSEQLLDMLAKGKLNKPLSDEVLNKLSMFDPNQVYLHEEGLPTLLDHPKALKFAKVGSEYVPIHSIAVNLPRTTVKPFIDPKQLEKAQMLMKTNPAFLAQNHELLDGSRYKSIQDLNTIGETIFPNHVVSVPQPNQPKITEIKNHPVVEHHTPELPIKVAHTTEDLIQLHHQQSLLSPLERKQTFMILQSHKRPPEIEQFFNQHKIDSTLKSTSFEDALAEPSNMKIKPQGIKIKLATDVKEMQQLKGKRNDLSRFTLIKKKHTFLQSKRKQPFFSHSKIS